MARVNGSAAARGYTTTHWKLRAQWKPMAESGQAQCHAIICLEERDGRTRWIEPGAPWHLGHTPDRTGWTGPEHQRCGASDGARRGNQQRPRRIAAAIPGRTPVCGTCGQEYHYAGKDCLICGRHYHPSRGVQYTCSRACGVVFKRLNYGSGADGQQLPSVSAIPALRHGRPPQLSRFAIRSRFSWSGACR